MITFIVYGAPVAQPRQRQRIVKTGTRIFAHNYTPTDSPVNAWKANVKTEAKKVMPQSPWEGPIDLRLTFFLPRPKNRCRKKDPQGPMWCPSSKDIDNLYKSVTDALSGLLYRDDRQIVYAVVQKKYHSKDGRPNAIIEIEEIG